MIELRDLVAMLNERAADLAAELLPNGHREGNEWVEASTREGGLGDSLKVRIGGGRLGVWSHFSADAAGDALDLVAYVLCDGDKGQAVKWAKAWLKLSDDPAVIEISRRRAEARRVEQDKEQRKREASAKAMWLAGAPELIGSYSDRYLGGRAVDLSALPWLPGSLRTVDQLWNGEAKVSMPAMVAAIIQNDGRQVSVHRTWLKEHRDGSVSKAEGIEAKKTLGSYSGAAIRLWSGQAEDGSKLPPMRKAKAGEEIIISEGIEDGLSLAMMSTRRRIMAAVSVQNICNIDLPPAFWRVIIACQNDTPGSKATASLGKAIRKFQSEGRKVKLYRPPAQYKDWNDWLQAEKLKAQQQEIASNGG